MKINLQVNADFDLDGNIHPKAIVWEDGRVFEIDRVLDVRRASSLKAGGVGIRYICRLRGKEIRLFNDEGHWLWKNNKEKMKIRFSSNLDRKLIEKIEFAKRQTLCAVSECTFLYA